MAELADAQDLGSCAERRGGSSPLTRTMPNSHEGLESSLWLFCFVVKCLLYIGGLAMIFREAEKSDLNDLLMLYTQLHDNSMPTIDNSLEKLWLDIIGNKNHRIIVGITDEKLISSCVINIIDNLTHNQQPYALVENVITHEAYRNKGYATAILDFAKEIAKKENCYKIMLLTGSKEPSVLNFYEKAGYNRKDKTAFIQWL